MNKVSIWILDDRRLIGNEEATLKEIAPHYQAKYQRIRTEKGKLQELAAGLFLAKCLGVNSDEKLSIDEHGKPKLVDDKRHFNLSHSDNYVVLAVSPVPVGIDIEHVKEAKPKVAKKVFLPNEAVEIQKLLEEGEDEKARVLFQNYWTQQEAILKLKGTGFSEKVKEEEVRRLKQYVQSFELDDATISVAVDGEFTYEASFFL